MLTSSSFEVLWGIVTAVAFHSPHNKLCYVTAAPTASPVILEPIQTHFTAAKRFLLLKRAAKTDRLHDENLKAVLNSLQNLHADRYFHKNIIACAAGYIKLGRPEGARHKGSLVRISPLQQWVFECIDQQQCVMINQITVTG